MGVMLAETERDQVAGVREESVDHVFRQLVEELPGHRYVYIESSHEGEQTAQIGVDERRFVDEKVQARPGGDRLLGPAQGNLRDGGEQEVREDDRVLAWGAREVADYD